MKVNRMFFVRWKTKTLNTKHAQTNLMSLADLEQTAALRTLTFLHGKRKSTRTQLIKAVNASTTTLYKALTKLKRLELIKEKKEQTFPFTVEVTLTQKGQKIANLLVKIEQALKTDSLTKVT